MLRCRNHDSWRSQQYEVEKAQEIFSLRSSDMMDVKIDVPESLIILVSQDGESPIDQVKLTATFSARPDLQFPLTFKEIATKADSKTRTFEVTYMMPQPQELNVFSGMTASVTIDVPSLRGLAFRVPQRAVFGDIHMAPHIWLLDQEAMTVSMKPVKIGKMLGDDIEILQGLEPGDKLVTSPSNFLSEGQRVQLLDKSV